MTLKIYDNLTQGTDEWLEARRGIVTASVVGQLITTRTMKPANNDTSRGLMMTLLAERITGFIDPVYVSEDMLRGTMEEPIARQAYADHTGTEVKQVGFMAWEDIGDTHLGYSPDGLVGDDGLIEIKSRRPKKHVKTILEDRVPPENVAQIQCGLLVSGRAWLDYVSFCSGMPLWIKRVYPDDQWADAIMSAVAKFEELAAQSLTIYTARTDGMPVMERTHFDEELTF
ncbi:lambda exonuclease family protein [Acidipropionibacterium jensenii]|uniref:lambda exonuclease family protein n=2 Tax=Acidipropionibacterium jensenii TaxID=1749 RepID=UPI002649C4E2|nr:lambda exonuclease family protein [Acidipropionibacterium jensenii]MDN5963015.1 YqaJ viral recombinase family protein [Actinomyces sp.]MDN6485298.1 YqaJ viral recombinase family protein [Bifidobacterium mongoliense]MDN6618021.1 YqaJ viral recombinase family protein [Corynebacterium variabile]MDN6592023.1 YqaJ viral recombinase family protein [Acidipropionibacterium jensenii]MDN6657829.1 YqaJ viral recombinase family protein [Acidipropionibacterium jensenii]